VTTVTAGNVVTLTATVAVGNTLATKGQVNFCDATAKYCTDIHLLGTAQLAGNGTAILKLRPQIGNYSYKAVLVEPGAWTPSASAQLSLTVTAATATGQRSTTTYLQVSGAPNIYSLTATVPGNGNALPTGRVSFEDTSNGNAVLGTAALMAQTGSGFAGSTLLPVVTSQNFLNSGNVVLTADFNVDGIPDLVILENGQISVFLGNGDGTFTAAPQPTNNLPGSLVVGDFNGDGIPDLAVAPSLDEGDSEVLLGKGDGTFTPVARDFGNANGVFTSNSMVVGDFNGDGNLDLAETCNSDTEGACGASKMIQILLGQGDGTFTQSGSISLTSILADADMVQFVTAVGDFNGDDKLDLAVTNSASNYVVIMLGNGDGTFTAGKASPTIGQGPTSIAIADFNGDGVPDLAVTNSGSNNLTILLGNGDGTFRAAKASPATGTTPTSVAIGDFNGDGVPDLAVANAGSSALTILLGNGDGTFTTAQSPVADTGSTAISVVDFQGNGRDDIVVANSADNSATVLLTEPALAIAAVNNISPAGAGTHLVKALYSGDANYGAAASADVILAVVAPSVSLSSSPVSIVAGSTGTSTVTITPKNGFTGSLTLGCALSSYLAGSADLPTCSAMSQSPLTLSGKAPVTTTVNVLTQAGTTPEQYTISVFVTDANGVAEADTQFEATVIAPTQGFSLSNTPVNIASPGGSGTSTITITPSGGFSSKVMLSCTVSGLAGAVDVPICSVSPPPPITSTSSVTATLTINTTAPSAASVRMFRNSFRKAFAIGSVAVAALLFLAPAGFRRRWNPWLSLLLFAAFAGAISGCGGAAVAKTPAPPANPAPPADPGTTAGSYTVTVTGVSGATTATTLVPLTVN
jgi:hypothetical protein